MRVAHLAFDLGLGHERRHRVDGDQVDRAGAHQHVDDLERLLAVVRLRHQQIVGLDAQLARVGHVERVLGVDERADAAALLRLRDRVQRERGLARGLRSVDLDDAAARQPADAERDVERQRSGRHDLDLLGLLFGAEPHDRALAELLFDRGDRQIDGGIASRARFTRSASGLLFLLLFVSSPSHRWSPFYFPSGTRALAVYSEPLEVVLDS